MRHLVLCAIACSSPEPAPPAHVSIPDAAVPPRPPRKPPPAPTQPTLMHANATYHANDRIRIAKRAGTIKPEVSGHALELVAGPGRVGTFLGGAQNPDWHVEVAVIRWDAQTWHEQVPLEPLLERGTIYTSDELERLHAKAAAMGTSVAMPSFTSTIHADYLELVR
jgi:hypothetical protein